jgi:hypothetical protein
MTVWCVFEAIFERDSEGQEYSDYVLRQVCSKEASAAAFIEDNHEDNHTEYSIEEWEVR